TSARLAGDCMRRDSVLKRLGWILVGGTPLFRLYQTGDAKVAQERLARSHILSRIFLERPGWVAARPSGQRGRMGAPGCCARALMTHLQRAAASRPSTSR